MTRSFQKLKVEPAYQLVSKTIEREIMSGRINPGDGLPTEGDLAKQFGVNRSTVREGLRRLEENGLVRRVGGKRLYVSAPRYSDLASRMSQAMVLHEVTFLELWEAASVIEPANAERAAERISPDELSAIVDNVRRTEEAVRMGTSLLDLDLEFHSLISVATRNRALLLARESIAPLFYPAVNVLLEQLPQAGERLLVAHRTILDALTDHDRLTAREWMRKHVADFKRGYELAGLDIDRPVDRMALEYLEKKDDDGA